MNEESISSFTKMLPGIIAFGKNVLISLVIFFVGRMVINWLRKVVAAMFEKSNADKGVQQFTDSLLKIALYAALIISISTRFGVNTASVAALVASCGVAIGLALQGSLSNFASGVMILVLKPFVVGDYISAAGEEGTVSQVQMFSTSLSTLDNRTVVIPNSLLTSGVLTNVTGKKERLLEIKVDISYESDLHLAKEILMNLAENDPRIDQTKEKKVFVSDLGANGVTLGLRVWTATADYWPLRWSLLETIKLTFDQKKIVIPYQQVDLHIESKSNGT